MSTVLQAWVERIPWKQQSILLSGLRGPDSKHSPLVKQVSRWIRKISQNDADPSQSYMAPSHLPTPEALEKELEFLPCHFVHHFADSLRVIALNHPHNDVKYYANKLHYYIADELFHFVPEDDETFVHRHRDRVEHA